MDDLRDYERSVITLLFPTEEIDFGMRFDKDGYSFIFLKEDESEDILSPSKSTIILTQHKISEETKLKLIGNKPNYITIEEFEPPLYKRYVSKVYRLISNPSLSQRIERAQSCIEKWEQDTDNHTYPIERVRKHLNKLLTCQTSRN